LSDLSTAAADQAAADLAAATASEQTDPVWEKAFDDAGIPDMLRPKLRETAKATTANAQKAIELARGGGVPPEWAAFIGGATESGVTPNALVDAWNAAQAIREDPLGFARDLNARINELTASGDITPAQAAAAREQGAQAIADAADPNAALNMKTPEQEALEAQQARLDAMEQQMTARQQADEDAQIQYEAQQNAENFGRELLTQLTAGGYTQEAGTLNDDIIGSVGRIAAAALETDQTGTLTAQAAISTALATLNRISGGPKAVEQPAVAGAPQQMPVGGGRGAPGAEAKPTFGKDANGQRAERQWREQIMLEEGRRIMNGRAVAE
jgi:hypothetical protein